MSRTLVLFVFHEMNNRVVHFLNNCVFEDKFTDFVIIANNLTVEVCLPAFNNVSFLRRDNVGFDFGGWSAALEDSERYNKYDFFLFVNSSVLGPFLPNGFSVNQWPEIYKQGLIRDNVRLFGSTINTIRDPIHRSHVQSYIFVMNKQTLSLLMSRTIFSTNHYAATMQHAIDDKEIAMSRVIIKNGGNIGCLMKYYNGVDFTFRRRPVQSYVRPFLDDIMYSAYLGSLWNVFEVVFVKGNRISFDQVKKSVKKSILK